MGLFDLFSGSDGRQAATRSNQAQQTGIRNARGDIEEGTEQGVDALNAGATQAQDFLQQGVGAQRGLLNQGMQGVDYYGNLLGLNGQEAAAQAFQGSPGYQWQQEQGLDALNRTANSRGMLASGNNTQDILRYSQGLASQDYYNQLNAAQPYFGLAQGAASGVQGGYNNMANVATGTASNLANLYTGQGTNLAGLSQQSGQANADMFTNQYNADQAANQNLWGAIMGVGSMAASALSDRRAKQDIKQVGTLDNGLPVYLFRYKHGGPFQIGLMAQDVEKVNPSAVIEDNGMKRVFYNQAVGSA
jgi:hypothetical protein